MVNPWFRFHRKVVHNYTVQSLDPAMFRMWINLMCLADDDGLLPPIDAVSFALHETKESVSSAFQTLQNETLIETDGETFHIARWKEKQYKSDTSTERVKRFRNRQRNVSETPQIQNRTEADTEQNITPLSPPKGASLNGSKRLRKSDVTPWNEIGRMLEEEDGDAKRDH